MRYPRADGCVATLVRIGHCQVSVASTASLLRTGFLRAKTLLRCRSLLGDSITGRQSKFSKFATETCRCLLRYWFVPACQEDRGKCHYWPSHAIQFHSRICRYLNLNLWIVPIGTAQHNCIIVCSRILFDSYKKPHRLVWCPFDI